MKMTGNELNYLDITFRIGYAIFLLPCQVVLTKTRPNWFLPSMEMAWGVMTGESEQ
jgi:ACS family pantothenate transporter-like MFS transporter